MLKNNQFSHFCCGSIVLNSKATFTWFLFQFSKITLSAFYLYISHMFKRKNKWKSQAIFPLFYNSFLHSRLTVQFKEETLSFLLLLQILHFTHQEMQNAYFKYTVFIICFENLITDLDTITCFSELLTRELIHQSK